MEANLPKFQGMIIPHGSTPLPTSFRVSNIEICTKATRQLHAISRISKYLNEKCKMSLYNAFIMSNFNYCNTIWHFCNAGDTLKLEKIQKRAFRMIFNDFESNYDALLKRADRPLLYVSRLRAMALETYKGLKKQNPPFLHKLFIPKKINMNCEMGAK